MPDSQPMLDWIVLKIVQSCNINCTYCYVYNRGDESWRSRPDRISDRVVDRLAEQIQRHCAKHCVTKFTVEFHGGEPLLTGKDRFEEIVLRFREREEGFRYQFVLQTNGLLLDREWLETLEKHDVEFGISIDGPPELADRYRVGKNGKGVTQKLLDKISELRNSSELFDKLNAGSLCVVNPEAGGAELVRWFAENEFKAFDFLLPDANWANPPQDWEDSEPYAKFLLDAFQAWLALGEEAPRIRIFETMILNLLGNTPRLDALGGSLSALCVVETDGSIGILDTLRMCGPEYASDTLNIFDNDLDEHGQHYGLAELGRTPDECEACPQFRGCRGGYLPHRYDGHSFNNPSFYCDALYQLSERMTETLLEELPESCIVAKGEPA